MQVLAGSRMDIPSSMTINLRGKLWKILISIAWEDLLLPSDEVFDTYNLRQSGKAFSYKASLTGVQKVVELSDCDPWYLCQNCQFSTDIAIPLTENELTGGKNLMQAVVDSPILYTREDSNYDRWKDSAIFDMASNMIESAVGESPLRSKGAEVFYPGNLNEVGSPIGPHDFGPDKLVEA
ncbi:hypothetical protein REPUB_Repub09cG0126300 [Reevesia pubescens]